MAGPWRWEGGRRGPGQSEVAWAGGREPGGDAFDIHLSGEAVGVPDRPALCIVASG